MLRVLLLLVVLPWWSGLVLAGSLVGLSPDELESMQSKGALVVDIRTPDEWKKTGMIPGSHGLTYFNSSGGYDKEAWLKQLKPLQSDGQALILVCRSGSRSSTVGKMLATEAGYDKVFHLQDGLRVWSAQNRTLIPQ